MGLFEVKAFKCEWCGTLFETDKNHHDIECRYNPEAMTCVSCLYVKELIKSSFPKILYCPKASEVFKYPCEKRCSGHKKDPGFEPYKPKEI